MVIKASDRTARAKQRQRAAHGSAPPAGPPADAVPFLSQNTADLASASSPTPLPASGEGILASGMFTLPREVRWGYSRLLAGSYWFYWLLPYPPGVLAICGENQSAMVLADSVSCGRPYQQSAVLVCPGPEGATVRGLMLAETGVVLHFGSASGHEDLQNPPEPFEIIPVSYSA